MKCKKCGAELIDFAKKCDVCGEPVHTDEPSLMDFYEEVSPDESEGVDVYFVPADPSLDEDGRLGGRGPLSGQRTVIWVAAIVAAALCVGILAFVFLVPRGDDVSEGAAQNTSMQLTQNSTRTSVDSTSTAREGNVVLPIEVAPANDLTREGSRIPVHVSGTLADGSRIEEDHYVDADGVGLDLEPGTYVIHMVGSPISAEGALYHFSENELRVTIPGQNALEVDLEGGAMQLARRELGDASEDDINTARDWASRDPRKASIADALANHARARYFEN